MSVLKDSAFQHVPQLRGKVLEPHLSRFRSLDLTEHDLQAQRAGLPLDWRRSEEERETLRARFHAPLAGQDLWVFAYGSLMWDPGIYFEEVRIARLDHYARRFCLNMELWRGSPETPGLMAALDDGVGCEGLVFRIAADLVEQESQFIWRREMNTYGYVPRMVDLSTEQGSVSALTFCANKEGPRYQGDLSDDVAARRIAIARGWAGTNIDYVERLEAQLGHLGLEDPEFAHMCALVRHHAEAGARDDPELARADTRSA